MTELLFKLGPGDLRAGLPVDVMVRVGLVSVLTKPYPLDLPVCLSVITTASSMSPKASKYFLSEASVVWYGSPPTKILVKVVSFCSVVGCMTSRAPFMN